MTTGRFRFYVGVKFDDRWYRTHEILKTNVAPEDLKGVYKGTYNVLVGPFVTKRGANYMVNNPYCECVADAEYRAKLKKEGKANPFV